MHRLLSCSLLILSLATAVWAAEPRAEVALVNGKAFADQVEMDATGSLRLKGNVTVHVERVGADNAVADVAAEVVTVIMGQDKQGKSSVQKLFANGKVHLEATTRDEVKTEQRHIVTDCDRVRYLAADGIVHLLTDSDQPIVAHITTETRPNAKNGLKDTQRYNFDVTARKTLDYRLNGAPIEEAGPGAG